MRLFSFSLLMGGGALLGHLVLYWRLVCKLVPEGRTRRAIAALMGVVTVAILLRGPVRGMGSGVARAHEIVTYSWMALGLYLVIAVVVGDLVGAAARGIGWLRSRTRRQPGDVPASLAGAVPTPAAAPVASPALLLPRRGLLQAAPWGAMAGGGLLAGYGSYRAFTAPEVTEVVVPLARLPRTLDGLRIVQLTDVHVGSFIGRRFIEMLVAEANALRPDLVVITGDLVDGGVAELGDAVSALGGLRARFGTSFVTGNHEFYSGAPEWVGFLETLGMKVLRNARTSIGDGGGSFDLVGVDDWSGARRREGQGYDLVAALAGRDPDRAAVLLAHQPDNFQVAVSRGVDLQISGHTHGGQLLPWSRLIALHQPYHRGLYRHGEGLIYVSRGCGFWGPPSRLDSPPELVSYILTSG